MVLYSFVNVRESKQKEKFFVTDSKELYRRSIIV